MTTSRFLSNPPSSQSQPHKCSGRHRPRKEKEGSAAGRSAPRRPPAGTPAPAPPALPQPRPRATRGRGGVRAALGAGPGGGRWEVARDVRACVRARSRWRRRIGEATAGDRAGIGPRAGAVRAAPSGPWGRGRSRGGRDWSGARERGGRSQGLGLGGWSRTSSPRGCRDSGRSAAAITDFLWDKRTGLAARTVSARAGGPRGRAERWRPRSGRGQSGAGGPAAGREGRRRVEPCEAAEVRSRR